MYKKRGRKPNELRRQQALQMRTEGLTLPAIAERMGVTKQTVFSLIKGATGACPPRRTARCFDCHEPIAASRLHRTELPEALCLECLRRRPETTFGQRLRAHRLAAGLSLAELAERIGPPRAPLWAYEAGKFTPSWPVLVRLLRVFGLDLIRVDGVK